jgi:hypothetical protein
MEEEEKSNTFKEKVERGSEREGEGLEESLDEEAVEELQPTWWIVSDIFLVFLENLLALRLVFSFLGVSPSNFLVNAVYILTSPFVSFINLNFPSLSIPAENSLFEGGTVISFFIFYGLHYALSQLKEKIRAS